MNTYAVEYSYVEDVAALDEFRAIHRDYLKALGPEVLVAAGAYKEVDSPGALLVIRADTAEQVAELLDSDPFNVQGLISQRTIKLWNPPLGVLA